MLAKFLYVYILNITKIIPLRTIFRGDDNKSIGLTELMTGKWDELNNLEHRTMLTWYMTSS